MTDEISGSGGNPRVYIGNLSYDVQWQDLKDFAREAGEVVRADVLLNGGGLSRGCGIVEYASADEAQRAMEILTNRDLKGRPVFVREDREPAGTGLRHAGVAGGSPNTVFVGNLPYSMAWQDLKDLFKPLGSVVRADVHMMPNGRSRGHGSVVFENAEDAERAIAELDGQEINGRRIEVRHDRPPSERRKRPVASGSISKTQLGSASGNGPSSEFLHVSNLPWNTTDDDLFELFQSVAPVAAVEIHRLADGRSNGTGAVQLADLEAAEAALARLNGHNYGGLDLVVTFARIPPA